MAAVYFLDDNSAPVDDGQIYCTIETVDAYLSYYGAGKRWSGLTGPQKDILLKRVTKLIDSWFEYIGTAVSDTQPLSFPRSVNSVTLSVYAVGDQIRTLNRVVCLHLEFELQKIPPGASHVEQETIIFEGGQAMLAPGALRGLQKYAE